MVDRIEITCDNCGASDTYPASQADTRRFCDIECKAEWQSEHVKGESHPNWKGSQGQFNCDACGDTFRRKPSEVGERNFCSVECKADWQSENVRGEAHPNDTTALVECAWCGDNVRRPRWRRELYDHQFCDKNCRQSYFAEHGDKVGRQPNKLEFECDYCGKTNERIPAEVKAYNKNFCDRECRARWFSINQAGEDHPNWKGGVGSYYGDNWPRKRRQARKRDRYECFFCGIKDGASKMVHGAELHVHHVRRKESFDSIEESNTLSNLLTLCAFCHQRVF